MRKNIISWINNKRPLRKRLWGMRRGRRFIKRIINPISFYLVSRRLKPISNYYGKDRGTPLDRYYIEKFISQNKKDVRGKCLEIENSSYTQKYGDNRVTIKDVLDIDKSNERANIHADLRDIRSIKNNSYDCIILTQVLQFIDNYNSAILECHRVLKPGGVLLITVPAISRVDCRAGVENDFWRFTKAGIQYSLNEVFHKNKISVYSMGNVLSGLAFWTGMAQEDLSLKNIEYNDPHFPVIIAARVEK